MEWLQWQTIFVGISVRFWWRRWHKMMSQSIFIRKLRQNRLGNPALSWFKIASNGSKWRIDICFGTGNECPPQGDIWDHIIQHLDNKTELTLSKCTWYKVGVGVHVDDIQNGRTSTQWDLGNWILSVGEQRPQLKHCFWHWTLMSRGMWGHQREASKERPRWSGTWGLQPSRTGWGSWTGFT